MDASSSGKPAAAPARPTQSPKPRRRFKVCSLKCVGALAAVSTSIIVALGVQGLSSIHSHIRATPSSSAVVRPLIEEGQRFSVEASIWLKAVSEPGGFMMEPELVGKWTSKGLDWGEQRWEEYEVTLPKRAVDALRDLESTPPSLFAYITLVPEAPLSDISAYPPTVYTSCMDGNVRGSWSPRFRPQDPAHNLLSPPEDPFVRMLDKSGIIVDLLYRDPPEMVEDPAEATRDKRLDGLFGEDMRPLPKMIEKEVPLEDRVPPAVLTRTFLTFPKDQPKYDLDAFKHQSQQILIVENNCNEREILNLPRDHLPCARTFNFRGHFENLLRFGGDKDDWKNEATEEVDYKYAPYLAGDFGGVSSLDMMAVPSAPQDKLTFTWKLHVSPLSTARFLVAESAAIDQMTVAFTPPGFHQEPFAASRDHDVWEVANAITGHTYTPTSRPYFRFAAVLISTICSGLAYVFHVLYWISLATLAGSSTSAILLYVPIDLGVLVVTGLLEKERGFGDVGDLVFEGALGMVCLWRVFRLEVRWIGRWLPIGVRRRAPTPAEEQSAAQDQNFGVVAKIGLFVIMFILAYFPVCVFSDYIAPVPPPVLSRYPQLAFLEPFLQPLRVAVYLSITLSQSILNRQLGTFGGGSRLAAKLLFFGGMCSLGGSLAPSSWGKWWSARPAKLVDVVQVAVQGLLASQTSLASP